MRNSSAVYKRLTDEEPLETLLDFELPHAPKNRKRRLNGVEYEEVLANYWYDRPETSHDRELFVKAVQDWVVYAFLFENADHGKGRNHDIKELSETENLVKRLNESRDGMLDDHTCKVEMESVCWWDVQEHFHNLISKQIDELADDLFDPLLLEAIERLKASGFLSWHSGYWTLSKTMSEPYVRRLKQRGRIFLAPKPSKLSGEYAA